MAKTKAMAGRLLERGNPENTESWFPASAGTTLRARHPHNRDTPATKSYRQCHSRESGNPEKIDARYRKGNMRIIIKSLTTIIITILLISSTVLAAKKKLTPPVRQQSSAVPTPLQQTLASKTYQRELQNAQKEQARLAWQMGALPPIDVNFFTNFFSGTQQYLEDRIWGAQQRPFPIRLENLGETCSFNALTQVLWRLTPLNLALTRFKKKLTQSSKEKLTQLIAEYIKSIAAKNAAPRTSEALMSVKKLIDILNKLASKELFDPFEIWLLFTQQCPGDAKELFNVATLDTVSCPIEGHDTASQIGFCPYVSIRVISKQSHNLQDMLNRQIQEETIEEVGALCTTKDTDKKPCNRLKRKTSKVLDQSPAILVIHTGRSTGERHDNKTPLLQDPVTFPLQDLTFGNQSYDLFGVVFRSGENAEDGHYYSWVRQRDNLWYCCNDDKIIETRNPAKIQSHNETFIFFYLRKKDDNTP